MTYYKSNDKDVIKMNKQDVKDSKRDLTQGSVVKKLLGFSIPLVISFFVMQLYNVADSIIVGQFVGPDALAAVAAGFPIMMFFNALYMGISTGATVVISQLFGAKDAGGLGKASGLLLHLR